MSNAIENVEESNGRGDAMIQNVTECSTFAAAAESECSKVEHLTARKQAAIELILTGATDTAVAEALAVHRHTVHRWRVLDERFRSELDRRRREVFDTANDRLRSMLMTALDRLDKQVKDRYDPTSHRAAKTLLTLARVGQVVASGPAGHRDIPASPRLAVARSSSPSQTPVSEVSRRPGSVQRENPPLRITSETASDRRVGCG